MARLDTPRSKDAIDAIAWQYLTPIDAKYSF